MTLRRNSDGELLRLANGALMRVCCCGVTCGSCDPPLEETYVVTITVTGDCTQWDEAVTVTWTSGCSWEGDTASGDTVYMSRAAVNWQIELGNTASQICDSSTDGYLARGDCDPTGSYSRGYFYGKSASTNYWDAVVS